MKRRLFAAVLALALAAGTAGAAGTDDRFPAKDVYPGYADVPAGIWYEANARLCYETGLIKGSNVGFEPMRTMTNAEAVNIAARMHHILAGGDGTLPRAEGAKAWYDTPVAYLRGLAGNDPLILSLLGQPMQKITRFGFLRLLALVLSEDSLAPINAITALPDTADPLVLRFYNAGILTGVSKYGFFRGSATLTRSEAAAMVSRVAREGLRVSFTPTFDPVVWASGLTPETVLFQNGGDKVTAGAYLSKVLELTQALGEDFNWQDTGADGKTLLASVKENAFTNFGVTEKQGTQAYRELDLQVFYSRYLDLTGGGAGAS